MSKQIVFCADGFIEQCPSAGAVLSFDVLVKSCPYDFVKVNTRDLEVSDIVRYKDGFWVFGNINLLDKDLVKKIINEIDYVSIESGYKFCRHGSPELHRFQAGVECDCKDSEFGKIMWDFMKSSKVIFWKSIKQREIYYQNAPDLRSKVSLIISGIFSDEIIDLMVMLRKSNIEKNNKYLILESELKGRVYGIDYCQKNGLEFEIIGNLSRKDMIEKMAYSKGLVFFPICDDTCPRIVTEAKLLGLECIVNKNVQQFEEDWFNADLDTMVEYLKSRKYVFWDKVKEYIDGK
jgi:hypothetical protein